MSLTQPALNAVAFAVDSIHINEIPISTTTLGAASFKMGFPYETMVEKIAGGKPPDGEDFNGIFNYLSKHQVWLNAGGTYKFNADLAEALGGYQKGAILASNDGLRLYVSTEDGNTTDFNTDMTGWKMIGTSEIQTLLDTLQTNINNEETARIATGDYLNGRIDFEIGARIAGDNALSDRVTILENKPDQPAIGFGQTYVNLTGSRFSGVNYPNSTQRPIEVIIFLIGANDSATCDFFIGNGFGEEFVFSLANRDAAGQSKACSAIVPVGSYCRIQGQFTSWRQLQ